MRKFIAILLAVMLMASMAIPAFAVTPALKIPKVPQISSIKFSIKLDEKLANAVKNAGAEAVKKIDFSGVEFTNIKLGG